MVLIYTYIIEIHRSMTPMIPKCCGDGTSCHPLREGGGGGQDGDSKGVRNREVSRR